jgi:hypothetical protein
VENVVFKSSIASLTTVHTLARGLKYISASKLFKSNEIGAK